MYVGKMATLTLKSAGRVKWETGKKSVATVTKKNKVIIKAKETGKTTNTATYKE